MLKQGETVGKRQEPETEAPEVRIIATASTPWKRYDLYGKLIVCIEIEAETTLKRLKELRENG